MATSPFHRSAETPVTYEHFADAIRLILGQSEIAEAHFDVNGFVHPSGVDAIAVPSAHSFRLLHVDEEWQIYMSFFGGRVGAVVRFRGPNEEEWDSLDVAMPLGTEPPTTSVRTILHPLAVVVEWKDMAKVIPSAGVTNVRTVLC